MDVPEPFRAWTHDHDVWLHRLDPSVGITPEWDVIERLSCTIRLLPTPTTSAQFHDFEAYERLVQAAERLDNTPLRRAGRTTVGLEIIWAYGTRWGTKWVGAEEGQHPAENSR